MTYDDLASILDWIQKKSSFTELAKALYCSIFSMSWTVWMRIGEVENLRFCDILHLSRVAIMKQQLQHNDSLNFAEDKEYVFPLLSGDNCSLQAGTKMDSYNINQVLQKCVEGLKLEGNDLLGRGGQYTLHCFRRGGAQHRFFECKKTWPLVAIKYWGGWSNTERMDTIVNYVLNEYENRYIYF